MHTEAYQFIADTISNIDVTGHVLEFGSRDVNGTLRGLFSDAQSYTGVDVSAGAGVDVVADAREYQHNHDVDLVLSTETLEHLADWRGLIDNAYQNLAQGGVFLLTAATVGRRAHGAGGGALPDGEHYHNIKAAELREALGIAGFAGIELTQNHRHCDIYALAFKPLARTRCIIVLGVPRSGTSTVAGTLHRLGVNMGAGHLQRADRLNSRGYYEDMRWQRVNKAIAGSRYTTKYLDEIADHHLDEYRAVIAKCNTRPLWGVKSPRVCFTLHHILPLLAEAGIESRMVIVKRDMAAVIASIKRHSEIAYSGRLRLTAEEATSLMQSWQGAFDAQIANFVGPTHIINYEEMLREPYLETIALTEFVFNGLTQPTDEILRSAIAWIAPELNHCGDDNSSDIEQTAGRKNRRPCGCK